VDFIELYRIFEENSLQVFKGVSLLIENRHGTRYRGGEFLISNTKDLVELSKEIDQQELNLGIALDLPQLISGNNINLYKICKEDIKQTLYPLKETKHNIKAIHLWGKKLRITGGLTAHIGDLNTLFLNNQKLKNFFLKELYKLLNDNVPRYFVPEVNGSKSDFLSIINDLLEIDFEFSNEFFS